EEPKAEAKPAASATKPAVETAPAPKAASAPAGQRLRISPLALRLAAEKGVDPKGVKGSGPGGRILRADIIEAAKNPPAKPAAAGRAEPVWPWRSVTDKSAAQPDATTSPSNMRATIARRLLESKT